MIEAVYIPLYAAADRVWGMERDPKWKKRPLKLTILVVTGAAGLLLSKWLGLLLAGLWLAQRSVPFKVFGGSMDPHNGKQVFGLLLRHLLAVPALTFPFYWLGSEGAWRWALSFSGAYALFATALGAAYGLHTKKQPAGNFNTYVEILRGAAYGAAIFATIAMGNRPFEL